MKKIALFVLVLLPLAATAQTPSQLKKQGKAGNRDAYTALGAYHEQRQEYKKAAKYYTLAATPQADYELATLYLNGHVGASTDNDIARGIALLRRSAAAGNRDGRYWLAYCYVQGLAGMQKADSAALIFESLAQQGDSMALLQLGLAYDLGNGVAPDTARALSLYRQAGDRGVSNGYTFLADFYRDGEFVGRNADTAFALYRRAYALGGNNTAAAEALALCHLNGIGTPSDTAAALPFVQEAAAQGSAQAKALLADYFNYGWAGLTPDGDTALALYYAASQDGYPYADYMMGAWLYSQQAFDQAFPFISSAASNGYTDAYLLYARAILHGNGVEADPEGAYGLLRHVAHLFDNGEPQHLLGLMHLSGFGCEKDPALAVSYLDTAAGFGNTAAMMTLGDLYATGQGVARDTLRAVQCYQRAIDSGSVSAMMRLAGSYASGRTAPLDLKRAAELYQQAADHGDPEALCRLGLCYERGDGVVLNSRRAFGLYSQAAEQGSHYGMFLLAMCYVDGVYVQHDMQQAFQWLLRAAEAGNLQSCYLVGFMYANGEGVKKSKKEAKRWLSLAAENGHPAAADLLKTL